MDLRILSLAAVLAMAALDASPVRAQQVPKPLLPEFPPDREVCYGRTYDKAHLAVHPHQKVESLLLFRSLTDDALSEATPRTSEAAAKENVEWERTTRAEGSPSKNIRAGRTALDVLVRFRGRSTVFKQPVECRKLEGKGFTCGVECDGGGFGAQPDGDTLMIRQGPSGMRLQSGCSSGDESAPEVRLEPGKDDRAYRLSRLPMSVCHAAREAARPEWIRPGTQPLRKRFATTTKLCLSTANALPAALAQRFSRIAVEALGPIHVGGEDDNRPDFVLQVTATANNGSRVSRALECRADEYSFDCTLENAGLRLTAAPGGAAAIRERFYDGGDITKLFGLKSAKLQPIRLVPVMCRSQ
jgi:hypothetical protein